MKSCFLIGFGESFRTMDKSRLCHLPAPVACCGHWCFINGIKTEMFFSFDPVDGFPRGIFDDPYIVKHVNERHQTSPTPEGVPLRECPNVVFHNMNESFDPATFLTEPTVNWGDYPLPRDPEVLRGYIERKEVVDLGVRASVLGALRILHDDGFRRVFMVGYDFDYLGTDHRAHDYWPRLVDRFDRLKPTFDAAGFELFNCSPTSALKTYPYLNLDDAIDMASDDRQDAEVRTDAPSGVLAGV